MDWWQWLNRVYTDSRLTSRDKATFTFMLLRMDNTREYRLGQRHIAQSLAVHEHTVQESITRLKTYGYITPIVVTRRNISYHLNVPTEDLSSRVPELPSPAPRMTMPKDQANQLVLWLDGLRRLYEAAASSDMRGIPSDLRQAWLSEADRLDSAVEQFTRWMARFGGGVDPTIRQRLDTE